jgi:hypothetical protein
MVNKHNCTKFCKQEKPKCLQDNTPGILSLTSESGYVGPEPLPDCQKHPSNHNKAVENSEIAQP